MEATLIIGQAPVPMDLGAGTADGSISQKEQLQEGAQQQQDEEEDVEEQHMQQDHVDEEADAAMQQDGQPVERQKQQLQVSEACNTLCMVVRHFCCCHISGCTL